MPKIASAPITGTTTGGASKAKKSGTLGRRPGQKRDLGITFPKARVVRIFKKAFNGRIGELSRVFLTLLVENTFGKMHAAACAPKLKELMRVRDRLSKDGKPKKDGTYRKARSPSLLPSTITLNNTDLQNALDTHEELYSLQDQMEGMISFTGGAISQSAKQTLEARSQTASNIDAERKVINTQIKRLHDDTMELVKEKVPDDVHFTKKKKKAAAQPKVVAKEEPKAPKGRGTKSVAAAGKKA